MDAARWKRLKEIVGEAMERPAGERTAFVAQACANDATLEAEVQSLLEHDQEDGHFVDASPLGGDSLVGREVGPYRIAGEIGHGGMGTVYLAERVDGAYDQRVAVKAIRRGMDTDHLLRRFRTERQILATLNHPNIARLLDGGALPDGRPYLVMEYVEGRRIDRYCEEERLATADRLRLFLRVCDAVSFAHQRLVVHRDIKPANVLVDAAGTPKLLDFGIAKLLAADDTGDSPATETRMRPMTPEYASPEQIAGQSVSTATDVYSLGVLLYELLTGKRPNAGRERETDPTRPSAVAAPEVRRRLQGDLDVIVLTALRREPERRYSSVEALAGDVRRHLEGLPVLARKDSWGYRAGRFASRNAMPLIATAVVAIALVTGTLVALAQARVARAERAVAEKRQNETLRLTNAMLFELYEGIDQGPTQARRLIVDRAFGYLDQLAKEAPDDPRLIHELASAYTRLASLQGGARAAAGTGGEARQARASFRKALALRERLARIAPQHFENRAEMGNLHVLLGTLEGIEGRAAGAVDGYRKGVTMLERAVAERPRDWQARMYLLLARFDLAQALGSSDAVANLGRPSEAQLQLASALKLNAQMVSERPADIDAQVRMLTLHMENATCLEKLGRTAEAHEEQRKALAIVESLVARHPDSLHYRRELAVGYGNLASMLLRGGDKAGALEYAKKALPLYESIAQSTGGDADAQRDLAIGHRNVGKTLTSNGDPEAAIPHLTRAVALLSDLTRRHPDSAFLARQLAFTHYVMAESLLAKGEARQSLTEMADGIRICEKLVAKDATNMTAMRTLAMSYGQAGRASEALTRWSEARAWYVRSGKTWAELAKAGEIPATNASQVTQVREAIARCDAAMGTVARVGAP